MPVYTFKCETCNSVKDVERPMSEAGNAVTCECGIKMDRVYNSGIRPDLDDYVATTGKPFFNKQLGKEFRHVNESIEYAKRLEKGHYVYDR